jgi:hypothetical protein
VKEDDDLNSSGSVCEMSLKTVSLDCFFTMTQYRVFILCYEYPTSPFSLCIYKGNERMGIQK